MAKRMPIMTFVAGLVAALNRGDGYIMGATGQNPKSWDKDSWWFTQYSGTKKTKALYWREHAARVWDCNGLAEGLYHDHTGMSINTYARLNYANWCGKKGNGIIPTKYRVPGAAVFWGDSASAIHHVGYLYKPVNDGKADGDWYIIEARGVMYGVVQTRLFSRLPNYWGIMDKYFDYAAVMNGAANSAPVVQHLGDRLLRNGAEGEDVRELQTLLIELGYDCGKWGTDGDFGDTTELAVKKFQKDNGLEVDGIVGPITWDYISKKMAEQAKPIEDPKYVIIEGGNCFVRTLPNTTGKDIGVAIHGNKYPFAGEIDDETKWYI